jgi:hypothetical protein
LLVLARLALENVIRCETDLLELLAPEPVAKPPIKPAVAMIAAHA